MHTSITFKNLDPSDALKSYVSEKLNRFDRYLDSMAEAAVVLTVEKFRHSAEITLTGDKLSVNAKEENQDMYSAIDRVLDKVEKQVKKLKEKKRNKRTHKARNQRRQEERSRESAGPRADGVRHISIETIEY